MRPPPVPGPSGHRRRPSGERRNMSKDVVLLAGTRPEAVKAAPVALALAGHPVLRPRIVHSGQHAGMVEQALAPFGLTVDDRLPVQRDTGGQPELVAQLLPA